MTKKKNEVEEPQNLVVFKLPESVEFPQVIFADAKDIEHVKELIAESGFVAVQQKDVIANRIMDAEEISEIRGKYGEIAENELPELYQELAELEAKFKADKKQLEAQISASNTQFKDLVGYAKRGIKDLPLEMDKTFRISVLNHYLYYTWVNDRFELALVQKIPAHQKFDIFNSVEKNKEVFEQLGFTLPEIEIEDSRVGLRRYTAGDCNYEVWEEKDKIMVSRFWKEDYLDEDTGTVITIDRQDTESYGTDNYKKDYSDIDPTLNEQTSTQEGTSDKVPGESEE
jgi:hypothetical protein